MTLKIENFLNERKMPYRLITLKSDSYTVDDVIKNSDGDIIPEEICKTIILKGKKSGGKFGFLLRGNDRVDFSKVRKLLKEDVTIASEGDVKEAAGVEPGAVCPFLLSVPLFVDKKVLGLEKINCGSGHHSYGLEFKTTDLINGVSYETADFSKAPTI